MQSRDSNGLKLALALFTLYIIWGSTYFVIRIGVGSWPPLLMAGVRFFIAGIALFTVLRLKGDAMPSLRQAANAGMIGILLLAVGNGLVTVAEHMQVPSGITAVIVATVPLFAACFGSFWGLRATRLEWFGIVLGLIGIILLNTGGSLTGNPLGALLVIVASVSWAFGSIWSSRLDLPKGMMVGAVEMIVAGTVLLAASLLNGERLTRMPDLAGLLAVGYLIVFGSMIAISAYMFLLSHARPALATSYAYVNPVVAVLLGMGFAGERLNPVEWLALGIIILAVTIVMVGKSFGGHGRSASHSLAPVDAADSRPAAKEIDPGSAR
ncbi:drug/metabolite exporter YedA [Acerihabitans arboris]|uniref:Drug/metabolite exporter YedA n=1 Tax=Acerihabitans arboris TaxID=2691583 RepID=A0A845SLX7_9GAMM|nr:drug/metabolite exporter YedA [Acerihabitans arboris]NDL63986.1 drug/metabolite exporter YedA [Acerihabitans arboris]